MRILFLLSSLEPAGSETYCMALAEAWRGRHEIFWISDRLHLGQSYLSLPITGKAIPMGWINARRVAHFIRRNKIDLVHSHSRRAHWVAAQAARSAKVPHVTTIHQPPPVHFFSKLFPCLGDETIAIDEVVADHLSRNFGKPRAAIHLIRNGIDLSRLTPTLRHAPNVKQILWIGRLTGGRWAALQFFLENLPRIAKTLPPAQYKIVGTIPEDKRLALINQLSIVGSRIAPSTIGTLGYVNNLHNLILNSDGAIAAGRSALECLALGRPLVILGEGGVLGHCRPEVWPLALQTNFGDHLSPKTFDPDLLESGLRDLLVPKARQDDVSLWCRAQMEKYFDIRTVAKQVEDVYYSVIPAKAGIHHGSPANTRGG